MSNRTKFVDKHGRKEIVPFSDSTVRRLAERGNDPFPSGQLVGGKRYWKVDEILAWMDRQGQASGEEAA